MKKTAILVILLSLAVGLASKAAYAGGTAGGGGIVAVMIAVIDGENGHSKADAKAPATLVDEFAALNSLPESMTLMEQSAGGSADLKAILK